MEALKGDRKGQYSVREAVMARRKLLDPIHPGEILREEFLKPLGVSINGSPATSRFRPVASVRS